MLISCILRISCSWFFILFIPFASLAQKSKKGKKNDKVVSFVLNDTIKTYSHSRLFDFPNVNRIAYYQDKRKMNRILALKQMEEWEALLPDLRSYISNFGIQNFYRDTHWLWKLASISEKYGNLREAKLLYKMVLRHHREDIDIRSVILHYDSITINDRDYYVSLDYYYELVDYRKEIDTLRPPRSVLLNMGDGVNSDYSDYGPTLDHKGEVLIFTSKRNTHAIGIKREHDEDLFFAPSLGAGYWDEAREFKALNTVYNEGSACLSKDGKTLYFARCDSPDGYGDCDIYSAELQQDSSWSNIRNLGVQVNSRAWDSHPSLSHSEDTLFFASDRIGGFGLADIYFTTKGASGGWQKAKNIGPVINTRNSELSPFYHHVHRVLYFSSNGHNMNFGGFDIYKTYHEENNWGEPKNIGPLVNGAGNEYYFTIDANSENLFYAKSVENNFRNLDLFSFPLPMEAQPGATAKVKGSLHDELTGKALKGIVSIIDLDHGIEVAPKYLRPDGSFEFDLINHSNYLLVIQGDEFFRIEELFYLDGELQLDKTTHSLSSKIEFTSLEFEHGKSILTDEMTKDLDKIANFLLDNPNINLKISGHTDSAGDADFNLKLSQERADAIMEYLVRSGGVQPEKIIAKGYGSTQPIRLEETEADRQLNRRVEFELYQE